MENERHWARLCGRRCSSAARLIRRDESDLFEDDPAYLLADILLEMLSHLRTLNQHLGVIMESVSGSQTPEQKQRRFTENIRVIQLNIDTQTRDLNSCLEQIQNDHPTLALGDAFMSIHQLDSNHRALFDLAKEAAGVSVDEIPPPPKLIDTSSSMSKPGSAFAGEQPTQIQPDETDQPGFARTGPGNPAQPANTQGEQKLTI